MNLRPLGPIVALAVLVAAATWGLPSFHRTSPADRRYAEVLQIVELGRESAEVAHSVPR